MTHIVEFIISGTLDYVHKLLSIFVVFWT